LLIGLSVLALVVAVKFGYDYFRNFADEADLQAAMAETDRLDPGWRLEELEANRAVVPAERDAAPMVTKVGKSAIAILNTKNVRKDLIAITTELKKLPPAAPLSAQQTEELRACLAPLAGPLADARSIAELPAGRYPFNCSPDQIWTLSHVDNATITIWLLRSHALLQAQDGDLDGAWADCQAIFNVARAFGDEPVNVQRSRAYNIVFALQSMERTLAQGQVSEPALARTQVLLKEEADHPRLLIALRGTRAHLHYAYSQMLAGKFSLAWERRMLQSKSFGSPDLRDYFGDFLNRHEIRPAHASLLRFFNRAIEIVKERGDDAVDALRDLQATADAAPAYSIPGCDLSFLLRFLDPKKNRAQFDCARTALAVERYRLKHERWPKALGDLVTEGLLAEVPNDPFDGKPLRYRATVQGIVVYSIGPNHDATGDGVDRDLERDFDQQLYFRLWNLERRRRFP
jgi:hypothetical protein